MKRKPASISIMGLLLAAALAMDAHGQARRSRQDGLSTVMSSSTAGEGNLHLTIFGRSFLWDNAAAAKIPPVLPHLELNYGATDYLDVTAGLNALSYTLQPGYLYLRTKLTTPDNKAIRFLGLGGTAEVKRNLLKDFPSNGYRVKSEGFGPEGFVFGNGDLFTSVKLVGSLDIELIRLWSYLPFKVYANLGWEQEFGSHINDNNADIGRTTHRKIEAQDFAKVPLGLGFELKTYASDFFVELEADPFASQVMQYVRGNILGREASEWKRFVVVGKTFDVNILEMPIYVNSGAKLKYHNGLELQAGVSWLLSLDRGPILGPCDERKNVCREGATDGFSPFYPQWKVFWMVRYPIWFHQPSSELYRSFLLRRFGDKRKRVNVDATLGADRAAAAESDAEERRKRLEERRKEADGKAVDLN
jgi:hypothetical protein